MVVERLADLLGYRLIHFHDSRLVTAPVAVVGSTKNGAHALVVGPLVPLHDQLVCSGDEHQSVRVVELFRNILYDITRHTNEPKQFMFLTLYCHNSNRTGHQNTKHKTQTQKEYINIDIDIDIHAK